MAWVPRHTRLGWIGIDQPATICSRGRRPMDPYRVYVFGGDHRQRALAGWEPRRISVGRRVHRGAGDGSAKGHQLAVRRCGVGRADSNWEGAFSSSNELYAGNDVAITLAQMNSVESPIIPMSIEAMHRRDT